MGPKTLTPALQSALDQLTERKKRELQELRLRQGTAAKALYPWGEELLTLDGKEIPVTDRLLRELLDRATGCSPYALRQEEAGLFLPLEEGCRMGLCGEAVIRDGTLTGLRHVSSAVIRFARQRPGIADRTAARITEGGIVRSTLILSPPGKGKTTFLRDLIRAVSERGFRVSVADERLELSAAKNGVPQLDLGPCTDVLTGCPKAQAMERLLRVMNPQVLAVDELSGPLELRAAGEAASCGVALFATAHAANLEQLSRRPGYRELLDSGAFFWCVTLRDFGRRYMERLEGQNYDKAPGSLPGRAGVPDGGMGVETDHAASGAVSPAAPAGAGADAGRDGGPYAARFRAV